MSNVFVRRVSSTPRRTPSETWEKIVELIAPDPNSPTRKELVFAEGVACSAISSEALKDAAIVVWGGGTRARIYCLFDEDAITQDGVNEDPFPKSTTEGNWKMAIPCQPEDKDWSNSKLGSITSRISVYSMDEELDNETPVSDKAVSTLKINIEEFLKP